MLQGNDGGDHVEGGAGRGRRAWRAEPAIDELFGNDGDDELRGGDGSDRLVGGDGNDRFDYPVDADPRGPGTRRATPCDGGPGDDRCQRRPQRPIGEADAMSGGDGSDTVDYGDRVERRWTSASTAGPTTASPASATTSAPTWSR